MIFRAIAYSTDEGWSDSKAMERVVFVDAVTRNDAKLVISESLTHLWCVPESSVEFYNLESEFEVMSRALGPASTGDQRLFEVGCKQGQPIYIGSRSHDQPLLLLNDSLHRMTLAYLSLPKE